MGRAGGKLILLGEHGVVHGRRALAAGLDRGAIAEAAPSERDGIHFPEWDLALTPSADAAEPLARAFHALLEAFGPRDGHVSLTVRSEIPAGAGLGCSAALGVATLDALSAHYGRDPSRAELGRGALAWERIFHGNPSGVDNAMAAEGGVALFRRGEALVPLAGGSPLSIVVAVTGESASTKEMVERVAAFHEADPARGTIVFDTMDALAAAGAEDIARGDHLALGQRFDQNQTLLAELGLSTAKLDALIDAARGAGALGAKLTGSGGGGAMIALARDPAHAASIVAALAPHSKTAFEVEVRP